MRSPLLSCVLLTGLCLSAQTSAPTASPHILVDTVGPDGWRTRLGPTNFGSMLESEKGQKLWRPRIEPLFGMWQQLAGSADAYESSRTKLLGYGGRIRVGLWFDRGQTVGNEATSIAFVLDDDGRSNLADIAKELRTTLYQAMPGEWADLDIDGTALSVRRSDGMTVSAPVIEDGHLLIAASSDGNLAAVLGKTRAMAKAKSAAMSPMSPALRIEFDFATLLALAMAGDSERARRVLTALGVKTVAQGALTVGTAGPRVQVEFAQQFSADDRKLFSGLMPATPTVPTLLPATNDRDSWTVGHFDLLLVYESAVAALAASDDEDVASLEAKIKEEAGIDPGPDLLAHMTDEVLLRMPKSEDPEDDLSRTPWELTFRLRDEAAFGKALFTMLPKARPFLQREATEEHDGVAVYRYGTTISYDTWLAVGKGVFVMTGGRDAEDRIYAMLDRCAKLPAALPADKVMPTGFESLARFLPPSCHGYSLGDATNMLKLPNDLSIFGLGLAPFVFTDMDAPTADPEADAAAREEMIALLREHRLDTVRSATGYADRTWRWRMFW